MFSLDVEGAEIGVLETIPWEKVDIRSLLIEVEHIDKDRVRTFLEDKGYQLKKSINNDQDYVFVKK